ncbi:MAG TPA: glycosyltransferase family 39 protein [bacterium]|nr:glycosyltransferase family 39 protein [bacterium]
MNPRARVPNSRSLGLLFLILVLGNAFLSCVPFPFPWKMVAGLLSVMILLGRVPKGWVRLSGRDKGPAPAVWAWIPLLLASAAIRFYRLDSLSLWPLTDEGTGSFFACQLDHEWRWNLLFSFDHVSPASYWIQALFYRIFPPSLAHLWALPALVSLAAVPMAYGAARVFFPAPFAFLAASLVGLSFWPFYLGRFNVPATWLPLWELLGLALLGVALKGRPWTWALAGAALAGGLYLFWNQGLLIGAVIGGTLLGRLRTVPRRERLPRFLALALPAGLIALPLAEAHLALPREDYLASIWAFQDGFSWSHYARVLGSYLGAIFWGSDPALGTFSYRPFWGGFLNPLLASAFFLGLLECLGDPRRAWARWMAFAGTVFLLPAFLTSNLEMFRLGCLMPLVLLLAARGLWLLSGSWKGHRRWALLLALALPSLALDLYHLTVAYPAFWEKNPGLWDRYAKQRPCFEAYRILEAFQREHGPGWVLNGFPASLEKDPKEQSLEVACFPFDAGRNPALGPDQARWAAFFAETPEVPLLGRTFPKGSWYRLGPPLYPVQEGVSYWMEVVDLEGAARAQAHRFLEANAFLDRMLYESLCFPSPRTRERVRSLLQDRQDLAVGIPFLESRWGHMRAVSFLRDGDLGGVLASLERGWGRGDEFRELGELARYHLDFITAEGAYRQAEAHGVPCWSPAQWKILHRKADLQRRLETEGAPVPGR